jgi:mannose/fructose/N-acetylgalactosamine-specific phosphotransferase system component IIB
MKILFLLFLLFLLVSSCKKEISYYPSKKFLKENNPKEVVIDDLNYGEIVDSISNELFKKNRLFIVIEGDKDIYKIAPFTYTGGFIKERNGLEIFKDSIAILDKKYQKSEIQKYLKLHYENNGKIEYLSTSPKYAFVKLVYESNKKAIELKKTILNLIRNFEKVLIKDKENIDLGIMLSFPIEIQREISSPSMPLY